jgi:hypothetical protein
MTKRVVFFNLHKVLILSHEQGLTLSDNVFQDLVQDILKSIFKWGRDIRFN